MTMVLRQYSGDFKVEAVRLLETNGKSASQLERDLGIGRGNLLRWKREFAADGENAFPGHGRLKPGQETIRQLEREKAMVLQEIAIIRKGYHLREEKKAVRFQFIDDNRDQFAVGIMCELLEVSPSGYYAWREGQRR